MRKDSAIGRITLISVLLATVLAVFIYFELVMYQPFSLALETWQDLSVAAGKDPLQVGRLTVSSFKEIFPDVCTHAEMVRQCLDIQRDLNSPFIVYKAYISGFLLLLAGSLCFFSRREIMSLFKVTYGSKGVGR